jgi:Adenylate and Guanylate cyclase catalytic domain
VKAIRAEAPAGTVTMLFTDIEGSSDRVRSLGADRWEAVLEHHTGIVREALAGQDGFEVRSEGDSFFAVFTSPSSAVTAAAAMQRRLHETAWPHQASVRVRMGLHTGEARHPPRQLQQCDWRSAAGPAGTPNRGAGRRPRRADIKVGSLASAALVNERAAERYAYVLAPDLAHGSEPEFRARSDTECRRGLIVLHSSRGQRAPCPRDHQTPVSGRWRRHRMLLRRAL